MLPVVDRRMNHIGGEKASRNAPWLGWRMDRLLAGGYCAQPQLINDSGS